METDKQNIFFFRFEDLRVYGKALDYTNWVYTITGDIHCNANCAMPAQFNNASRNIAVFIAEGSGRSKTQFIYYLKMAKSAIRECLVLTTIAFQAKLITEADNEYSRNALIEMTKMVGALIASLQRSLKPGEEHEEEMEHEPAEDFNKYNP